MRLRVKVSRGPGRRGPPHFLELYLRELYRALQEALEKSPPLLPGEARANGNQAQKRHRTCSSLQVPAQDTPSHQSLRCWGSITARASWGGKLPTAAPSAILSPGAEASTGKHWWGPRPRAWARQHTQARWQGCGTPSSPAGRARCY